MNLDQNAVFEPVHMYRLPVELTFEYPEHILFASKAENNRNMKERGRTGGDAFFVPTNSKVVGTIAVKTFTQLHLDLLLQLKNWPYVLIFLQ